MRILPDLLLKLEDYEQLYQLALSTRNPESIEHDLFTTSKIQIKTLRAAVRAAVIETRSDMIVKFSIELVLHTFSEARNEYYLIRYPDLISVSNSRPIDYTQLAQSSWQDSVYAPIIILSCIENKPTEVARYVSDIREQLRWLEKTTIRNSASRSNKIYRLFSGRILLFCFRTI